MQDSAEEIKKYKELPTADRHWDCYFNVVLQVCQKHFEQERASPYKDDTYKWMAAVRKRKLQDLANCRQQLSELGEEQAAVQRGTERA